MSNSFDPFSAIVSRVLVLRNVRFRPDEDATPVCDDFRSAAVAGWLNQPSPAPSADEVADPEDYSVRDPAEYAAACADAYTLGVALRALLNPLPAPVPAGWSVVG